MPRLIPWYYEVAAVLVLLGLVAAAVLGYGHHEYTKGEKASDTKYEAKYLLEVEKVRADEALKRTAVEKAHAEDVERMAAQTAAAADARTERDGLLAALARRTPSRPVPAPGPGLDGTTLLSAVVAACGGRYEEVAGAAGALTAQVIGLQNYLSSVGLAKQTEGKSPAAGERLRGALIEAPIQPAAAPLPANSSRGGGAPIIDWSRQ